MGIDRAFPSYLEAYLDESRTHQYSDSHRKNACLALGLLFRFLKEKGIQDIRQVSEAHVVSFANYLQEVKTSAGTTFAPMTQSAYISVVRRFFAFLDKRGFILRNPALGLQVRRPKRLPRTNLSPAQVRRLLNVPTPTTLGLRDRALVETLYGTAIRCSECVRLDIADVDLQRGELLVRDGKGKKDRRIPIPRGAIVVLELYFMESRPRLVHDPKQPAFFLTREGRRISKELLEARVRDMGLAAGIAERVYPHALRHACASHLLQKGMDIRLIQELLGHNQIQTTAQYLKVQVRDLRKVLARSHPRQRARKKKK